MASSGPVWSAKRKAELDMLPQRISALNNLDRGKKDKGWIPNSGGWILITGQNWLLQYCECVFEVVALEKNPFSL